MDIERHEFDVVQNLAVFPTQIVFETHLHNAYGMFRRPVSALEWTSFWKSWMPLLMRCLRMNPTKNVDAVVNGQYRSDHA